MRISSIAFALAAVFAQPYFAEAAAKDTCATKLMRSFKTKNNVLISEKNRNITSTELRNRQAMLAEELGKLRAQELTPGAPKPKEKDRLKLSDYYKKVESFVNATDFSAEDNAVLKLKLDFDQIKVRDYSGQDLRMYLQGDQLVAYAVRREGRSRALVYAVKPDCSVGDVVNLFDPGSKSNVMFPSITMHANAKTCADGAAMKKIWDSISFTAYSVTNLLRENCVAQGGKLPMGKISYLERIQPICRCSDNLPPINPYEESCYPTRAADVKFKADPRSKTPNLDELYRRSESITRTPPPNFGGAGEFERVCRKFFSATKAPTIGGFKSTDPGYSRPGT